MSQHAVTTDHDEQQATLEQASRDAKNIGEDVTDRRRLAKYESACEILEGRRTHRMKPVTLYRRIAMRNRALSDGAFRLLDIYLDHADSDLTNCFLGLHAATKRLGGAVQRVRGYHRATRPLSANRARSLERVRQLDAELVRGGWIIRHVLREGMEVAPDVTLERVMSWELDRRREGQFISARGIQFCLPPGELARFHRLLDNEPWLGPTRWPGRRTGQARAGSDV